MSLKKQPFIRTVQLAEIDGKSLLPTTIYYDERRRVEIGFSALEYCPSPELLIQDFKIDLGRHNPDNVKQVSADKSRTGRITSVGVAQDFFDQLLAKLQTYLSSKGKGVPKSVLIAEPISLSGHDAADEEWLSNYRRSLRRALRNRFDDIDFMPEPFAVFQYYRYGVRHPLIAENRKHIALVIDFGGGTFDVSVIETASTGDVSRSGKNSRPLAAKSQQIGGFYYNRMIAEEVLFSVCDQSAKSDLRKAIKFFSDNPVQNADSLTELSDKRRNFFKNYRGLLESVEKAKIAICRSIANWSLDAPLRGVASFPLSVPVSPFEPSSRFASVKLDAEILRDIFTKKIWHEGLRTAVERVLLRSSSELDGKHISVVLLSGGSSNIGWLERCFSKDFASQVPHATVVELNEDFQEIVAKGLATECTRRFYTEGDSDFRSVTYNRLCFALRSDDGDLEIRKAKPTSPSLMASGLGGVDIEDGVLLPSANSMISLFDEEMLWKVRLSKPPKRCLEYYFLRSSFDPEDLESRYNVEDFRADTPANTRFHSAIEVELRVRRDGSAFPAFIYGRSDKSQGVRVEGRPFYIDMTAGSDAAIAPTYLGLDFGSSTTSCSYVDAKDVQVIEERNRAPEWRELSDLVHDLPYPVSEPLARFLSEPDADRREKCGRQSLEAMLALAAYLAFVELGALRSSASAHFKGFAHRSAGPLWALLRQSLEAKKTNMLVCRPLVELLDFERQERITKNITGIAKKKHEKDADVDYLWLLTSIGNRVSQVFRGRYLGVFENVSPKRFSHNVFVGVFRVMDGHSQTFTKIFHYEGAFPFSEEQVFLVDVEGRSALPLSPLYLWGLNQEVNPNSKPDLVEYDGRDGEGFTYKSVQRGPEIEVRSDGVLGGVFDQLSDWSAQDPKIEGLEGLVLTDFNVQA